jgi:hypothetical protein
LKRTAHGAVPELEIVLNAYVPNEISKVIGLIRNNSDLDL